MDTTSAPKNQTDKLPFFSNLIATGLFSGYSPIASGTAGSLVGLLLYYGIPGMDNVVTLSLCIIIFFFVGVRTSATVARIVGNRLTPSAAMAKEMFQAGSTHAPDPSIVVIDEVVGMWISLLFLPKSILIAVMAFLAFRIFDIVKPFPAKQLEHYANGWGIMLDDVVAGMYANIVVHILLMIIPGISSL